MDLMCNANDNLLLKILSYFMEVAKEYGEFKHSFSGPQAYGLSSILSIVRNFLFF